MQQSPWNDESALEHLDRRGYKTLDAISLDAQRAPAASLARPYPFVCIDGSVYWGKANAQHGLSAELIAARLGSRVGVAASAEVIRVVPEVVAADATAHHLIGVIVGVRHVPDTVNVKDLGQFVGGGQLPANSIDSSSRACVVAFQTWIGVGDGQVMINLSNGKMVSIDHGECFQNTNNVDPPALVITQIPGIVPSQGSEAVNVDNAASLIESIDDATILQAVAAIPIGAGWQSDRARRLQIGKWLANRRDLLREVMKQWK